MTTAVRLSTPDADEAFVVASVRLDHDSQTARERGASLLADRFGDRGDPTVVAGGFNCTPADRPDPEVFLARSGASTAPTSEARAED